MTPPPNRKPGDALLDRYVPTADNEARERARDAFRAMALFIYRVGERLEREQQEAASSPKSPDGAIISMAPGEPLP